MDEFHSPEAWKYCATLAAAKAALAANKGGCFRIRCTAVGELVVRGTGMTAFEKIPFAAGETQRVRGAEIDDAASTGCAPLVLFF